jgi:hypothetical protein
LFRVIVAAVALLTLPSVSWSQTSLITGTWKADPAKSRYSGAANRLEVSRIFICGDEQINVNEQVDATGVRGASVYTAKYDGRDYPINDLISGVATGRTVALRRIDARREERVVKLDGKVRSTVMREVTEDGSVLTTTTKNADGQVTDVRVFARQ